ncbi:MAG: hypothetical protein M3Q34_04565 [bacterium]|nr:hypothetical protein [bacterium]
MPLDKKKIKEKLEKERDLLLEQMKDMGTMNPKTGEWEATPEDSQFKATDQNDMADRFEDFESKSSMIDVLEDRLRSINNAINAINKETFGTCKVCNKQIEVARLEVNPAARTCKKHMQNSSTKK